jgi:hypothetical protein
MPNRRPAQANRGATVLAESNRSLQGHEQWLY